MAEATDKATRPTEVFVCGKRFDIRYGGSWIDESFTYGSVDFCKGIIDLKRGLSEDHCREFLWHELVHCADKQLDLNLSAVTKRTQDERGLRLYEPEVLAFSTAQWMTLSDPRNAGVISWMLGLTLAHAPPDLRARAARDVLKAGEKGAKV
jgi:hypothetical protein